MRSNPRPDAIARRRPAGEAAQLKDMVEVVQYYQHQIWVKLMRANGFLEEKLELLDDILKTPMARPRWR